MKTSSKTKMTTIIAIILLMASITLMAMPTQAQIDQKGYGTYTLDQLTNVQDSAGRRLPSGVTPDMQFQVDPYLSFRPNPVGVGQTILVNLWTIPGPAVTRYFTDFKVTITKPDGTTDVIVMDSYMADSTAWFEYVVDQVGTWKLQFEFPGQYFPAGNYTLPAGTSNAGFTESFSRSLYYEPASTAEQTLTVQEEMVYSWPDLGLPTDYWTRPISAEHREWWTIAGDYPWYGPSGGSTWDELYPDTNPYWNNAQSFTPWVQAPNTAHIVWKRLGALSGIVGGDQGYVSLTSGGGSPDIIYQGRAYQTVTKPFDGVTQSVWQCYDIRTGEIIWERTGVAAPSYIEYGEGLPAVPGATASVGITPALVAISGNRLIKYTPATGAASVNVSIPAFTSNTYYMNGYVLSIQTLNTTGGPGKAGDADAGIYRLINWTTFGTSSNFTSRIVSNITWPRGDMIGTNSPWGGGRQDFETGIAFIVRDLSIFNLGYYENPYYGMFYDNATGFRYGTRIKAWSMATGEELWDINVSESVFNRAASVADNGKIAACMQDAGPNTGGGGYLMCWDQYTGKLLWKSEQMDSPWDIGGFGAYGIASAYGMVFRFAYSGVYAFDWDTGKIVWKYEAPAFSAYETPYTDADGNTMYSFNGAGWVADGKVYAYNTEHSPSQPITRGWGLHCINVTTGELIWKMKTPGSGVVADGYLSVSSNDGYQYVYGKGKSAASITAPDVVVPQGTGVVLKGTVLDMSPAQPNTPCVSKDSMTTQMEYLHNQMPIAGLWGNETITGVPVSLDTVDPNGNFRHIADVVTDGYSGTFAYTWTPDVPGQYAVTATFMGDDSYGSSFAQTYVSISEAPPASATPEPPQVPPDNSMLIIGATVAIILAVAIVGILILRKRP